MAFLLINLSQPVYSQIHGKWKVPVQCVADPNVVIESRLMEISFGVNNLTAEVEPHLLQYDDLPSSVYPYTGEACYNYFNYYDTLYQNPFDLREDSLFVNGNRMIKWNDSKLYYESFRFGKVIDLNGQGDYCFIHSNTRVQNAFEDYDFGYNLISKSNNTYSSSPFVELFQPGTPTVNHPVTFKVIDNVDGTRSLVTISDRAQFNYNPALGRLGIISFPITSTGIDPTQHQPIVTVGSLFVKADFSAWQFEAKFLNNETSPTYIWCSSSSPDFNDTVPANLRGNFYVYNTNYQYKHLLNLGYIAGVAFSELYPGYAYVSVTGNSAASKPEGIYKVNIQSGTYTSIKTGNYGHTWLKKSPDGHIYAVSDNGKQLGRINQETGIFEDALNLPSFEIAGNTLQAQFGSFQLREGVKYFTLPDDSYKPKCLEVSVSFDSIPCNYLRTNVLITGGVPPYQIEWWKLEGSTWVKLSFSATSIEKLKPGHYKVIVKDSIMFCGETPYEFDVPEESPADDMLIEGGQNKVISQENLFINSIIRVKANGKLTLTGCNVQFRKNARLIIEDGGTVTLNNTVLTSCDSMWRGVEVWGNRTFSQEYDRNIQGWHQGRLIMSGSTIENSLNGVDLWRPNAMGNTGGIISASNSVFRNNGKAIHICYYVADANMLPKTSNFNNKCSFTNCTFEVNNDYKGEVKFYKHVDLAGVKGVKFTGCDFSVIRSSKTDTYCSGIAMYDAGATIEARGLVNNLGTPVSFDNSTFTGFYNAVYGSRVALSDVTHSVVIDRATFSDNATGVRLSVFKNSVVTRSAFNLGLNYGDMNKCSTLYGSSFGVDLSGCSIFRVEENSFNGGSGGINHDFNGVKVNNCPSLADIVYKNSFSNLMRGNYAKGENRANKADPYGVSYECNAFNSNRLDFYVDTVALIGTRQGQYIMEYNVKKYIASGNVLTSPNFSGLLAQFRNDNFSQIIDYYQWQPNSNEILSVIDGLGASSVDVHNADYANTCLSKLSNPNSNTNNLGSITDVLVVTKEEAYSLEQEYQEAESNHTIVSNLLKSLTDGGSTEETVNSIEMSNSSQTMELRDELLDKSPYLSQEALMTAADKTEVLPEDILFEILAANPDELRRKELIEYLRNKPEPLPEYMISLLEQLASGVTSKTALLNDINYYATEKSGVVNKMLMSAIHDTTTNFDQIRLWLGRRGDLVAKEMIVSSYLEEGNLTQALSSLNNIPSELNLSGISLEDYNDYKDLLLLKLSLDSSNLTFKDIDTTAIIWLEKMAAKDFGQSKFRARAILEQFFEYHFFDCLVDPGTISPKSTPVRESYLRSNGLILELSPNPASNYTLVKYDLNGAKKALLTLFDIRGMKVFETEVLSDRLSYTIDTRYLVKGSYVVRLSANGIEKSAKLLVN